MYRHAMAYRSRLSGRVHALHYIPTFYRILEYFSINFPPHNEKHHNQIDCVALFFLLGSPINCTCAQVAPLLSLEGIIPT